jgi:GT2 family glycosyltransferase
MPTAEVLELDGNRGFAAGINAGIDHVRSLGGADAYVVANPDILLEPLTLARLLQASRPRPAIAVPQLHDRGTVLPSLSRTPSIRTTWADALLGGPMSARLGLPTEMIRDPSRYNVDGPVGWATGGLMLIDGSCADAVGPWDESYFMYDEEVDYSIRAADHGYPVWYVHDAHATRLGGADRAAPWAEALMKRNRVRTLARRRGGPVAATAAAGLIIGAAIRAVSGRPEARAALWALVTSASPAAIRARYGPCPLPEWRDSRSVKVTFSRS